MKLPEGEQWLSEEGLVSEFSIDKVKNDIARVGGPQISENTLKLLNDINNDVERLKFLYGSEELILEKIGKISVELDMDHIFIFDVRNALKWSKNTDPRLTGLHHDFLGSLEKNGIIKLKNIKQFEHGIYEAELVIGDISKNKTWFPQHWTREKTAQKIFEAAKNPKFSPQICSDNVIKITGITSEGIEIRIIIQGNKITTAYPLVK